jgi:hypothetical protein
MEIGKPHLLALRSDDQARQRLAGRRRRTSRWNHVASVMFTAAILVPACAAFAESMSTVTTRNRDTIGRDYGRAGDDEYWEQPQPVDFPSAAMQSAYDDTKAAASRAYEDIKEFVTQPPAQPSEEPQHYGRQ